MNLIQRALATMTVGLSLSAFASLPENYNSLSSLQKQDALWSQIEASHEQNPLPEITEGGFSKAVELLKGLFKLAPTFDHVSDEVPDGRVKIIHANGVVGKVRFESAGDHPFTGLFKTGGIGLARLSLAAPATDDSYIPGMAVKILLPSDTASVNLHVMNRLNGQKDNWNFFDRHFTNKIDHAEGTVLKFIEKIFEWTKSPANELTLAHFAAQGDDGEIIANPVAPEKIIFKPSSRVHQLIEPSDRTDFRLSLEKVGVGHLYEVYGFYQGNFYHIGSLMLESPLLASDYGDKTLFFQHQR